MSCQCILYEEIINYHGRRGPKPQLKGQCIATWTVMFRGFQAMAAPLWTRGHSTEAYTTDEKRSQGKLNLLNTKSQG